jgi:tRNA(Arg) A34 adenosine deaminase TadA
MSTTEHYLKKAIDLARQNAEQGGRPFGCVIVKDGNVVASAVNTVVTTGDPTAHAETEAIRAAAKALNSDRLDGCILYASGHPCPMCLAAMYVSGIQQGFYAFSIEEAPDGLSLGGTMYEQFRKPISEQSSSTIRCRAVARPSMRFGSELPAVINAGKELMHRRRRAQIRMNLTNRFDLAGKLGLAQERPLMS